MTPRERAIKIINTGGQILLPFESGDAAVKWDSRHRLADAIEQEILAALKDQEEKL